MADFQTIFSEEVCDKIFPATKANEFFEALFGDAEEGAYDIRLRFEGFAEQTNALHFTLDLIERPGCCLVCNLTYGLPEVFSRHPIIGIKNIVKEINDLLGDEYQADEGRLAATRSTAKSLHQIPLIISLN